ncbi:MAG TPA: methyltransferase domain-containing protein [Candidatus Binatia bacterium]|nr:methyltransferase domain-containing protein [Candidatus Binatia bacterium]
MSGRDGYVPALGFRWLTPAYDVVVGLTTRERAFKQALLAQANLQAGQRALDLACGTGTLAILAAGAVPEAGMHGIDGDPQMLARARRKAQSAGVAIEWREGLSTALPWPDGTFDRVLSSLFFHHLDRESKRASFTEVVRVLRPGGELHVADWGAAANPLMRAAYLGIQLLDGFANTADNVRGLLPKMMEDAGLREVRETRRFSTMFGTLSLYRAQRP